VLFTVCRVQSTVRCSLGKGVNEGRVAELVKEGILFVPQAVSGFQACGAETQGAFAFDERGGGH